MFRVRNRCYFFTKTPYEFLSNEFLMDLINKKLWDKRIRSLAWAWYFEHHWYGIC
jgi:hypothetical protein